MKGKNIKYKLNSWVITVAVLAAVILGNAILGAISEKLPLEIDMTKAKQFEFADETKEVMKKLDKEVKVTALGPEENFDSVVIEYFDKYKALSNKFSVEYINVYENQSLLYSYQSKGDEVYEGDFIVSCGDSYKIIPAMSIYSEAQVLGDEQVYSFALETKLTNAIVSVTGMMEESAIYFLEGHGEGKSSALETTINTFGYKNEKVNIINNDIPEDAKLLVTVTPTGDFTADECEKLDKFLDGGGNLMVVYTPGTQVITRFESYLEEWGIVPHHNMVLEKDESKIIQSPAIMMPELLEHDITSGLIQGELSPVFYGTISLGIEEENTQKAKVTALAKTTASAIGKTDLSSDNPELEEGDSKGPFTLAAVAERKIGEKTARVMVMGSAAALELPEQFTGTRANSQFVSSTLTWLTNNQTNLKISPKVIAEGIVKLPTKAGVTVMYYTFIIILPLVILAAGIIIWLRRRYL